MRWFKQQALALTVPPAPTPAPVVKAPPTPLKCGRCMRCRDWFRLDRDGAVRVHGLMHGALCTGSNLPAVLEW